MTPTLFTSFLGSPPPMRGKDFGIKFYLIHIRITPAYAGKREFFTTVLRSSWDHPRLCGEKRGRSKYAVGNQGSPPPMRGKEFNGFPLLENARITPAYAGKRLQYFAVRHVTKDHPRLCGEKRNIFRLRSCGTGSPPPMRGKVPKSLTCQITNRITPAYAGKSLTEKRKAAFGKDHPRLCGEKVQF